MTNFVRWSFVAASLAASVYAKPLSTPQHELPQRSVLNLAPLAADFHPHGTVNSSYIIKFKDDVHPNVMDNHFNFVASAHAEDSLLDSEVATGLRHIYDGVINGYSGMFSERVIDQIRAMAEVEFVERDQIVRTTEIQRNAPWGLARISHRKRLRLFNFKTYLYNPKGGEGVDAYVIDTGINVNHDEFEGRASWGQTMPENDQDEDANGHGTHCAGTIASAKYGVAKGANVIAVKVLGSNGSGTMSDVVKGVEYASKRAQAKAEAAKAEFAATGKTSHKGSVANMSLGGGKSRALDISVNGAVDKGLHFAVAAGNDNRDACSYSPAAAEKAITVGASTNADERAYFSNYGKCVDVFGPGLNILSTWIGSKSATNTISGTSMASPHTAGLLAYLLSIYPSEEFDPTLLGDLAPSDLSVAPWSPSGSLASVYGLIHTALPSWSTAFLPVPQLFMASDNVGPKTLTPDQLKTAVLNLATSGALSDLPKDTPNLLIFNNFTTSG